MVVARKFEKPRVEPDDIPDALEDGGFQIVVEKPARDAAERDEGRVMAA